MEKHFASNVSLMIIVLVHAYKRRPGFQMSWKRKPMLNGCLFILNFVLGAKKQLKEVLDVILWLVSVEKASAFCAQGLGNLITKTILNVIFTKKVKTNLPIDKKIFLRKWIFLLKDFFIIKQLEMKQWKFKHMKKENIYLKH